MKIAVIRFPGSNCDLDAVHAFRDVLGQDCQLVWHKEFTDAGAFDAVLLPGGWSYDDRLRSGAIAAFSPAVAVVKRMADAGKPVVGICNGFQVLTESGMLPGALLRNENINFISRHVKIACVSGKSVLSRGLKGKSFEIPIAHGEGRYVAEPEVVEKLFANGQVVFQYDKNYNGSVERIAGICNEAGNVVGMMPHPERAMEKILGSDDGRAILASLLKP